MEWRNQRRAAIEERLPERRRYHERLEPVIPMDDPAFSFDRGHQYSEVDVLRPAWQRLAPRGRIHPEQPAPSREINISPAIDMRASRRRGAILGDQRVRRRLQRMMAQDARQ